MDELTAFERQIAGELGQMAGPGRRIDVMALARTVTTPSSRWSATTRLRGRIALAPGKGGFTMSSALKFAAAGAIVALFGGFLLAGLLPAQLADDVAPAAVTESPTPITTEALLSTMVSEEVEPGVLQVVSDGFRDLAVVGPSSGTVDVGPGGEVWVSPGPSTLYRLGDGSSFPVPALWPNDLEIGPDGTLWAVGKVVWSFDGEAWTRRSEPIGSGPVLGALAIGPDGTVWVVGSDHDEPCADTENAACAGTVLMRLEDDGSLATIDDWAAVYDGDAASDELAVAPDGAVWLIGIADPDLGQADGLLRFDGSAWTSVPGPECFVNTLLGHSMAFDPDGTLWVHTDCRGLGEIPGQERHLARFDGSGWTAFGEADGVHDWGRPGVIFDTDLLTAAPDGSLWLNEADGGVAHFDGGTWTSYLQPYMVDDIAVAPDGRAWAWVAVEDVAWEDTSWQTGLFVITPETSVTTE